MNGNASMPFPFVGLPSVWSLAIFIASYVISGSVGQELALIPGVSITFWPPVGILMATMLLSPSSSWRWWIAAGGIGELTCNYLWFHNAIPFALIYYSANALEAWTGTWLASRWMRSPSRLETLDEVLVFLVSAAGLAPMVSATIIATTDALIGKHPFFTAWPLVWLGDSSAILVSTPLTYAAIQTWRDRAKLTAPLIIEAASLGVLIGVVAGLAFKGVLPTAYLTLPPLLWTAVRFQLKGAAVALAFLTLITALFTVRGEGEFTGHLGWSSQRIIMLQTFLAISAVSTLVVATLSAQRHKALLELQSANNMLEGRVADRTNAIRQSEERLRLANQAGHTGIVEWNANGDDGYWSDEACLLFGFPPGTIPTHARWKENIHPDDLHHAEERVAEAFAEAEAVGYAVYRNEFRVCRPDDRTIWLLSTGELRRTSDGLVLRGVVQDVTSRRQAELALLKTASSLNRERERLSLALVAGRLGVYEWNLQSRELWWSPETYLLFGLEASSFTPSLESFRALVHPDDWDELWQKTKTSIEQRDVFAHEYRIVLPDGTTRWIYNRSTVELDAQGEPLLITGVTADVSEAKQIEQALRESESRFRQMADHAPVMVWVSEANGERSFLSKTWYEFTGQSPSEGLGSGWLHVVHPDDREQVQSQYQSHITCHEPFQIDYRLLRADGVYRWAIEAAAPRLDTANQFHGYIGSVIDITERKEVERQLAEGELRFKLAAEAAGIGIVDFDAATGQQTFDEKAMQIWGFDPNQPLTPHSVLNSIHPVDRSIVESAVRASLDPQGDGRLDVECRVVHADQSVHWIVVASQTQFAEDDAGTRYATRAVGTVLDITHRKAIEQELAEQQTLLQSANAALKDADRKKDEFLATLAHELRNPLAPIRSGLQLMRLVRQDPATIEQAHSMMERQLKQMVRLIDDLLDVSRISRGKLTLQIKRIPLSLAIRNAIDTSRSLLDEKQHHLSVTIPDDPLEVDGDETRLSQVFANLLNNAAKYTDYGGQLRVTVVRHEAAVDVAIEDNGIGIPQSMLGHVFEMFTQVDHSLEKSQGGLGIGLNIVQRLVELHGGSVTAHSDGPGQGSRFIVTLPVPAMHAFEEMDESPSSRTASSVTKRRILIVDDNRDAAMTLAMMLRATGSETRIAHDGLEAISLAEHFRPDVIVLDLGMPKLNGYDACRRIREQSWGKEMLLVALSGWGQEEDKRKSRAAGFDAHLVKPVEFSQLQQILSDLTPTEAI